MSWTYSGNPARSQLDHVRFLIGDTVETDQQLSDQEIEHCLALGGSVYTAAVRACEALVALYSRQVSKSIGSTSISAADRAKAYASLATQLATRGGGNRARPRFGGTSASESRAQYANPDFVRTPLVVEKPGINDPASGGASNDPRVVVLPHNFYERIE